MKEETRYALGFFSLDPGSGKVTALGEIPLSGRQVGPWSAGGNKLAVSRKAADGGNEIVIYTF